MRKLYFFLMLVFLFNTAAFSGEKSEKVGEAVGSAAKETKEAGKELVDITKKTYRKVSDYMGDIFKDTKESAKDFRKGVEKGYKDKK